MYFIHGLGGHAFKSWSIDRGFPQMWPRDFLPNDIKERPLDPHFPEGPKLAGRFSTIGYRANIFSTWSGLIAPRYFMLICFDYLGMPSRADLTI
jgi:hypothetical protein